jgi:hypothetical protein
LAKKVAAKSSEFEAIGKNQGIPRVNSRALLIRNCVSFGFAAEGIRWRKLPPLAGSFASFLESLMEIRFPPAQ